MFDPDGAIFANSNLLNTRPESGESVANIRFPIIPAEVDHFITTLKTNAPHITDVERDQAGIGRE